jgi:hypothetical protein
MAYSVLFVLLGTFLLGVALMTMSLREHLQGGGLPLISSMQAGRTPRARQLFKRFVVGSVIACLSMVLLLYLGHG